MIDSTTDDRGAKLIRAQCLAVTQLGPEAVVTCRENRQGDMQMMDFNSKNDEAA